ncbi:MAG TPA: transcription antitermination factor NusB [Planctomycetota bacterium]|nr:transcription antitermination factor NusB [Planctomycetota bacterium]
MVPDAESVRAGGERDGVGAARWRAFTALVAVERGKAARLRTALRLDDLAARDRALGLELSAGVERRRITIDALLLPFTARGILPDDPFVRTALRLGAYQVLWLPRIPVRAAVHGAVGLLRRQRPLVNALLRRLAASIVERAADPTQPRTEFALPPAGETPRALVLPRAALPDPVADPIGHVGVLHGLPADLVGRWFAAFGAERAAAVAAASAEPAGVTLRVQPARGDAAALQRALAAEGVLTEPLAGGRFLRLRDVQGTSPFSTEAYREGRFSVQDPTAFAAAAALAPEPGETLLDLCAAPGGKATALAELLRGRGRVFAYDPDAARLRLVEEARRRLGLEDVLQVVGDLASVPERCDGVLADVPCSNTGVLARRVEVRRRSIAESIARVVPEQRALLATALARTRPGGRVVYSTCSLEPEENRGVVEAVLAAHPGVVLVAEQTTLPAAGEHDGGYLAVLRTPPAG